MGSAVPGDSGAVVWRRVDLGLFDRSREIGNWQIASGTKNCLTEPGILTAEGHVVREIRTLRSVETVGGSSGCSRKHQGKKEVVLFPYIGKLERYAAGNGA